MTPETDHLIIRKPTTNYFKFHKSDGDNQTKNIWILIKEPRKLVLPSFWNTPDGLSRHLYELNYPTRTSTKLTTQQIWWGPKKIPGMEGRLFTIHACPQKQLPRQIHSYYIYALSYGQESSDLENGIRGSPYNLRKMTTPWNHQQLYHRSGLGTSVDMEGDALWQLHALKQLSQFVDRCVSESHWLHLNNCNVWDVNCIKSKSITKYKPMAIITMPDFTNALHALAAAINLAIILTVQIVYSYHANLCGLQVSVYGVWLNIFTVLLRNHLDIFIISPQLSIYTSQKQEISITFSCHLLIKGHLLDHLSTGSFQQMVFNCLIESRLPRNPLLVHGLHLSWSNSNIHQIAMLATLNHNRDIDLCYGPGHYQLRGPCEQVSGSRF